MVSGKHKDALLLGMSSGQKKTSRWSSVMDDWVHRAEDIAHDLYDLEEDIKKKLDDRLFPDELLYCEGLPRPVLRGVLHLVCSLLLPLALWFLLLESNGNSTAQIACCIYIGGNFFLCFTSALFHIGKWSPSTEILLQKLDHMGIAVCSSAINFPTALLLLPHPLGALLAISSTISCIWTCYNVFIRQHGVWRLILNASVIGLFFYPLFNYHMTWFEIACVLGNTLAMMVGAAAYVSKRPDPWPLIFGYHEIFHVFTVVGFTCIFLCNWSIIHRVCNPYDHYVFVQDILWDTFIQHKAM